MRFFCAGCGRKSFFVVFCRFSVKSYVFFRGFLSGAFFRMRFYALSANGVSRRTRFLVLFFSRFSNHAFLRSLRAHGCLNACVFCGICIAWRAENLRFYGLIGRGRVGEYAFLRDFCKCPEIEIVENLRVFSSKGLRGRGGRPFAREICIKTRFRKLGVSFAFSTSFPPRRLFFGQILRVFSRILDRRLFSRAFLR